MAGEKKALFLSAIVCVLPLIFSGCAAPVRPPAAKKVPVTFELNGDRRTDDYYWLKERDNPEVIKYLEAENAYTNAVTKHTRGLQRKLYKEMLSRIKETDLSVPVRIDDYYYYTRTEKGKQYPINCRKKGSLNAKEEIILDQNRLARGKKFCRIGAFSVSPNHKYLAYSEDNDGSETFTIYIKDLDTGTLLKDQVPNTYYSVEWANDNKTIFYDVLDEVKRPYKLYKHKLGTDPAGDELIYHEKDDSYYLSLSKTRSRKYLLLNLASNTTSEVHFLDADNPQGSFKIIHPRQHEMEYYVEHHEDNFYIVTNDNAKNFKLVSVTVSNPAKENWKEVIGHSRDVKIDGVDAFVNHLVVSEREKGLTQIRIMNLADSSAHKITFPEPVYTCEPGDNREFKTNLLRFNYTSLVTPASVFDYDMNTKTRELKKRQEVLGGYDPNTYQSERIFAKAADGNSIPISLVYKKPFTRNGTNTLMLNGYGSYGSSTDPTFSANRLSLLDRGFVFAIAHIRGGGEMGRIWYEDGKLLNKKNTFSDFIACAEHLIAEKYTCPGKIVIQGGSAGGLLMGAVVNMRPDLFKAVIANVPFVDVINTMLDPSIPLTVTEYEEWGNPNEKVYYDYMKSYSPYDNVERKDYPNILITAGLNDPRVQYWEPAKWTAKLRDEKLDNNMLNLRTKMEAGHGEASGR